jgi:hypothetical protein
MNHYNFANSFHALYDQAVTLYAQGERCVQNYFNVEQVEWLSQNGLSAQNLYDYAEDHHNQGGEPGFDVALGIEYVRRDYFINVQTSNPTGVIADPATWPAKTAAVRGIEWLPRILPKTRAKLSGELPTSLMYCCGGDRRFFKAHDIHPVEFLNLVWRLGANDEAIHDWVIARSNDSPSKV